MTQDKRMGRKPDPNSIRAFGRVTLACDKPTRESLRFLAGPDGTISGVLKELVDKELSRRGTTKPLTDMGRSASSASLSSISEGLKELGARMNRLEASIVVGLGLAHREYDAAGNITGAARNDWDSDAPHLVIKEYLRRVRDNLNAQQLSFNDGEINA